MQLTTDFLVIGSGIAGLRAALDLAVVGDVVVLTKAHHPTESNTGYAQGGIAAAIDPHDSPALHAADTLAAGDGLCDEAAVRVTVEEGPRDVLDLAAWGAAFDREPDGQFELAREGAHGMRRVLHAADATGREIGRVLWERVRGLRRVQVRSDARAVDLLRGDGRCAGARFAEGSVVHTITAAATLLATGGAGRVYRETSNPPIATGDGIALAWRAGARVADLEFVQFHPTVLSVPGAPRFLMSEALRGEGARLLNERGERFMSRYEPAGELASRDLVSRAIVQEAARTGGAIYLSLQHLDPGFVHERFPTISAACREAGYDLARQPVPVSPAAHYIMGGVDTDIWARTTLPGLFAAGEAACTGLHGANRLASNSLLEGLVYGRRAAAAMQLPPRPGGLAGVGARRAMPVAAAATRVPAEAEVQELMWTAVGLVRERAGLEPAVVALDGWRQATAAQVAAQPDDAEPRRIDALVTVGWLVARAALDREESRGGHARADFPARDDIHWRIHVAERSHDQET